MPAPRDFIDGPWRAVPVLGVTQILSWGSIFYTPVLIVPLIAAERGWSMAFAMGGFSVGLLAAGLSAPYVGRSIDRFGGHVVMTVGSLIAALGLVLITQATGRLTYLAVWVVLGVAMAANLYDSAFATLGRIFGIGARAPITALTLAGGFASTVSWPATHFLIDAVGWRGTYLVYAALLACISAPLHALALPRTRFEPEAKAASDGPPPPTYAFVPSGLSAHLLAIFARSGIDAGTVVWIGALFGPAQVGARLIEFAFGRNLHPLWVARFALSVLLCAFTMLALLGFSVPVAAAFALMFGGANGLVTITRGAVPLALFGASGYGRLMGRLAGPFLLVQAAAPLVMAFVVDRATDPAALALAAGFAATALVCFVLIKRPG
jgi:MFS family permease